MLLATADFSRALDESFREKCKSIVYYGTTGTVTIVLPSWQISAKGICARNCRCNIYVSDIYIPVCTGTVLKYGFNLIKLTFIVRVCVILVSYNDLVPSKNGRLQGKVRTILEFLLYTARNCLPVTASTIIVVKVTRNRF